MRAAAPALALAALAAAAHAAAQPAGPAAAPESRPAGPARADEALQNEPTSRSGPVTREVSRAMRPTRKNLVLDAGFGFRGYLDGDVANLGPTWTVRLAYAVSPWVLLELNYIGAANERAEDARILVTTQVTGDVRANLLASDAAVVQPFLMGGVGYAAWSGAWGDGTALVLPVGGGIERAITPTVKAGVRTLLVPAFFDDLATRARRSSAPPRG